MNSGIYRVVIMIKHGGVELRARDATILVHQESTPYVKRLQK